MQKWEYMSIWVDEDWKVQTIVGCREFQENDELPHFVEFLNLAGERGWEMINVVSVTRGHRVFFKRPRA